MRKILGLLLLLIAFAPKLRAQGVGYTITPPVPNGTLYVCKYVGPPMPTFPCVNFATIYTTSSLGVTVSQPVSLGASGITTFYGSAGQQFVVQIGVSGTLNQQFILSLPSATPPGGGTGGGQNALGTAGPNPQFASYTIYLNSGTVYARNNSTGAIDYSSADAAVVVNSVLTANATVGGRLYFKNGVYNINSMTVESTTGCSTFDGTSVQVAYAIGFPSNTPFYKSVQWYIEGETAPVWMGEAAQTTANTTGVIFNITSTAVSSVTAGDILAGFWARPVTNCTLASSNVSNDLIFKNIGVRFPVNTRGNEVAIAAYFANTVQYGPEGSVVADFAVPYNTLATGSAPTIGTWNSIGLTTTVSSAGNWQDFRNTYVAGYNLAYDFQSEHVTGTTVTAIYNNIACEFGRSGSAVFHPSKIDNFVDQENGAGCIWGPQVQQGTFFDIYFDFEFGGDANWYSTARNTTAKLSETPNFGYSTGILRYQAVKAGSGVVAEIPASSLFTAGGSGFQAFEATNPPSIAITPISDTFTRPNATSLGPAWLTPAGCNSGSPCLKIASNSAQVVATGAAAGWASYGATAVNPDQFSKATCATLPSAVNACEVQVRVAPSVQTYYTYYIGGNAATGRGLAKVVAGSSNPVQTGSEQTSAGGTAGDVIELDVIGNTLWAYRNGALDTSFTNPAIDASSPIASGAPGILVLDSATGSNSMTNWTGGSMPTKTGTDSIYANPGYQTIRFSVGAPPTPTGTGACATITTQVPASVGSQAGSLKCTGTTGASTITLTFPAAQTAPNGWRCSADDETTVADRPNQTSFTTTTCVLTTAATAQNDVIVWSASPF